MKHRQPDAIERRTYDFNVRAIRAAGSEKPTQLEGYAAVFNRTTVLVPAGAMWDGSPEVREVIEPGAFTKTLREADVRAVWNHNTDYVLGRKGNKTLDLWEDERGLGTRIVVPDTQLVRDMVVEPIDRGDVNQMSFAFQIVKEDREESKTDQEWVVTYRLREVRLIEVSPVAIPAYEDTEIAVSARSRERIVEFMQERRQALAEAEPGSAAHSEAAEGKPVHVMHHLDESLRMALETERVRRIAA